MNRETKFKFVIDNKHLSKIYTIEEILNGYDEKILDDMEQCDCTLTESSPYCEGDCLKFENSKITGKIQFTGRIDLNGKEIYEGDIIRVPYGRGKVEFADNQGMFIITWIDDKEANTEALAYEPNLYRYGRTRKDLEVIGNIYENAGLLAVTPINTSANDH